MSDSSDSSRSPSESCDSDSSGYEVQLRENPLGAREVEPFDGSIQPWRFEPQGLEVEQNNEDEEHDGDGDEDMADYIDERMGNTDWCTCEFCQIMDRREEFVCCQEVEKVKEKVKDMNLQVENEPTCITLHPGFAAVCLNIHVLQTAWYQYRQQYGTRAYEGPGHKKNRHIAYRQLDRWCWGVLGKEIRVVLPSCAVSCIRAHFPPPGPEDYHEYAGFLFADE